MDAETKAALKAQGLRADGTPRKTSAERKKSVPLLATVGSTFAVFGIDGLAKMAQRYGAEYKRPLRKYATSLVVGDPNRGQIEALIEAIYPRGAGPGRPTTGVVKVGRQERANVNVRAFATQGDSLACVDVALPDGRAGVLVYRLAADEGIAPAGALHVVSSSAVTAAAPPAFFGRAAVEVAPYTPASHATQAV